MIFRKYEKTEVSGHCAICWKWSEHLNFIAALGYDVWVCPECERKTMDRIKRRYMTAGEHTEPAE